MPRTHYVRQRDLVDGLMDFSARLMRRTAEDQAEMRRLTTIAQILEAGQRENGDPERIADMLTLDAATSNAAD